MKKLGRILINLNCHTNINGVFIVSYAGTGIAKKAIPTSSLFRINNQPAARAGATQATTTEPNSLILTGSGTDIDGTIKSYNWQKISGPENGLILVPGAPTTSLTKLALGSYQYQLTVKDNSGSEAKDTLVVIVKNAISGEEPAFSLTETDIKTYTIFQPNNELTVFPNPVSNIAYLDIKSKNRSNQVMISVYNFSGTKVRSNQTGISSGKTQVKLDLTGLPKGIYTIVTRFEDGQVITNKILKGK